MHPLKFAIFGTGFWARFQLAGWREIGGTECVAVYNRTVAKAEAFAREFGIPAVYGDPEVLLTNENLDFVDIITDVGTHSQFVHLAAAHGLPVVCQKPMAPDLETARTMVQVCANAGVPLLINENWRWQYPIRQFKRALVENDLGWPFRAHIRYINSFPVFDNQPFLKDLEEFIIADIGSHILDTARYLFGDAQMLYCQTQRVTPGIQGEDVATVMLQMESGMTVVASMSYASPVEHDRFPETYIHVECERGAVELGPDFWVRVTTDAGTLAQRHQPPHYPWADPAYDVVHASIVSCQKDLLHALQTGTPAETSGADNFKTMQLVFGAYRSARS
ncbi:MAG: Gfo/Idh/MocA family protein, partial [Anaerolineae bacterium]